MRPSCTRAASPSKAACDAGVQAFGATTSQGRTCRCHVACITPALSQRYAAAWVCGCVGGCVRGSGCVVSSLHVWAELRALVDSKTQCDAGVRSYISVCGCVPVAVAVAVAVEGCGYVCDCEWLRCQATTKPGNWRRRQGSSCKCRPARTTLVLCGPTAVSHAGDRGSR